MKRMLGGRANWLLITYGHMPVASRPPTPLDLRASLRKPLKWALGAALLTALITVFMPDYYRSEARLLPVEAKGQGNLGQLAVTAAAFGVSLPGGEDSDANAVDIVNSRWLREQLLRTEFQYHARGWRFGSDQLREGTLYDYLDQKNMDRAVKKLTSVLTVSRDLKSKVITLSAETKSPELSQQVVRRADDLLGAFLQQKEQTRGSAKADFTEARLQDARGERAKAEDAFRQFLENNRNYQTSADPTVRLKGARLEAELKLREQLVLTLAVAREQALLEAKDDVPILNVLDAGNLPIEKSKPARSLIVILVALLMGIGSWSWMNREWIRERLLADEDEAGPSVQEPR